MWLLGNSQMKNTFLKVAVAASLIASLGVGAAASAATQSATARARILRQVTLTNTTDLQFGTIVSNAAASTVLVSTSGARTCGTVLVCSGTTTAAHFDVAGTTGQIVTVVVDPTVTLTSGSNSMTAVLTSSAALLTLASNAGSFNVGGLLTVGASQADGDYAGSFNATADYQ